MNNLEYLKNLENDIRLSQGVLACQSETTKTYIYSLKWFPDVQELLNTIREEVKDENLEFKEPCLTLVIQKSL